MTRWQCPFPGCPFTTDDADEANCPDHGLKLRAAAPPDPEPPNPASADSAPPGPERGDPEAKDAVGREAAAPEGRPAEPPPCRHCGAAVPNWDNVQCLNCMRPLAAPALLLRFNHGGTLELVQGQEMVLGRTPDSPAAEILQNYRYVSRVHATVGVDEAGQAWIRDEDSTNDTLVNDEELVPREKSPLRDGDLVVLGRAQALVKLAAPPP